MNLVFIYGPPAVGKLTIAEELSKLTGYKLFHNHITQDLAKELYPEFNELRFGLVDRLRLDVFEYAAQNQTNLIFTYVNNGDKEDNEFVSHTINLVTERKGNVFFVELSAPNDILIQRVANDSRKQFHKINDATTLKTKLENTKYASVQYDEILRIDTSEHEPDDSARQIIKHYKLKDSVT